MQQKATFSMNCFWGPQDFFFKLPGILNTIVGYTGGTTKNPTYTTIGDHTETIEIMFDPKIISYEQLLKYFLNEHDPTEEQKTQYKSIIFYHSAEQKELAESAKKKYEEKIKKPVYTEIKEATTFYPAEEYHQHYTAKARKERKPPFH